MQERTKLNEAPKDVKRLEILKPGGVPRMGKRHETALSKEKRLEMVARPLTKIDLPSQGADKKETEKEAKVPLPTKKMGEKKMAETKRTKKKSEISETEVMEQEDSLQEGVDWSDEEDKDGDDESSEDDNESGDDDDESSDNDSDDDESD